MRHFVEPPNDCLTIDQALLRPFKWFMLILVGLFHCYSGFAAQPAPTAYAPFLEPIIEFESPGDLTAQEQEQLRDNVRGAVFAWHQVLLVKGPLRIRLRLTDVNHPGAQSASLSNIEIRKEQGQAVVQESAAYKIVTGNSANRDENDLVISINPFFLKNELWLDPQPFIRQEPVPRERTDCVSLLIHELFHTFGFSGFRHLESARVKDTTVSLFDRWVVAEDLSGVFFNGPYTTAINNGRPLELTSTNSSQNIYHYGNRHSTQRWSGELMNGIEFYRGRRYTISPLDLAIAKDINLPVR